MLTVSDNGEGIAAGESGQDFRSVLHHQVRGQGRRPRARGLLRNHPGARRRYRSEEHRSARAPRSPCRCRSCSRTAARMEPRAAMLARRNEVSLRGRDCRSASAKRWRRCAAGWPRSSDCPVRELELPSHRLRLRRRRASSTAPSRCSRCCVARCARRTPRSCSRSPSAICSSRC